MGWSPPSLPAGRRGGATLPADAPPRRDRAPTRPLRRLLRLRARRRSWGCPRGDARGWRRRLFLRTPIAGLARCSPRTAAVAAAAATPVRANLLQATRAERAILCTPG